VASPRPCPNCGLLLTDWSEDGWQCEGCAHYGVWTTGWCFLCNTEVASDNALDHLRLIHPDHYEEPARWPDGKRVVVDETLEPNDFGGDDGR